MSPQGKQSQDSGSPGLLQEVPPRSQRMTTIPTQNVDGKDSQTELDMFINIYNNIDKDKKAISMTNQNKLVNYHQNRVMQQEDR